MSGDFPQSWLRVLLNDVGEIVTGKTPSTKNPDNFGGSIPFIKPADLDNGGYVTRTADTLTDAGAKLVPTIPPNSIPVTCIGNLGKVGITNQTSATNQQINTVVPSSQVDYRFFYYQLQTLKPWMQENASATTVTIINKGKFSKAPVTLAPLAEQKVIADKLDTLLAQVENTKARLERIPQILKRFRQSVLAAAVSGRLTEEWRVQSSSSEWRTITVGELCKLKSGIAVSAEIEKAKGDFKYFKVGEMNLAGNELFLHKTDRYLARDDAPEKSLMPAGAIVFPKRGGAIATNKKRILKDASFVDLNVMGIVVPEGVNVLYIYRWFETVDLGTLNTGSAVPQVNNTDIAPLKIPLPPLVEQTEIVRRVDQLFAHADRIEQQVNNALARVNNLTQSILAKAFRGVLTEQWRKDNPELISGENSAEALLEKIKAERSEIKPTKRRSKKKMTA